MSAQLALALLALGPLKASLATPPAGVRPKDGRPSASRSEPRLEDHIAGLAQEWLKKR